MTELDEEGYDTIDVLGSIYGTTVKVGNEYVKVGNEYNERVFKKIFNFYSGKKGNIFYIGYTNTNKDYDFDFFIQWKSSYDSDIIGQYPDALSLDDMDSVVWGEYKEP